MPTEFGLDSPVPGARLDDANSPESRRLSAALSSCRRTSAELDDFVWIGLVEATQAELNLVADVYEIPELQIEDASNPRQRAKIEMLDNRAFIVFKTLTYSDETSQVETGQMSLFAGPGYVVTVRYGESANLNRVRHDVLSRPELLRLGPASIAYQIVDLIVDDYLEIVDEIGVDIEQAEERMFSPDRTNDAEVIYKLKRENLEVRRAVIPLTGVGHLMAQARTPGIPAELQPYFRDIGDHLLRVTDSTEANDNLLMSMLEAANARQSIQQNDDMRKISAWVAIAAVPTAIAGIYGMNFENMPELRWADGYFMVLAVMVTTCSFLYYKFKRSGWL